MIDRFARRTALALLAGALLPAAARADYTFTTVDLPGNSSLNLVLGISNNRIAVGNGVVNNAVVNFTYDIATGTQTAITSGLVSGDILNQLNTSNTFVGQTSGATGITGTISGAAASGRTLFTQPTPTAVSYIGQGINDGGIGVGQYTDAATGITHGLVYNIVNNTVTYTNVLADAGPAATVNASVLPSINNNGLAVGYWTDANTGITHAYEYNTLTNTPILVSDPTGATYTQLDAINDKGIAAGYYVDASGNGHGILYDTTTNTYLNTNIEFTNAAFTATTTVIFGIDNAGDISGFYFDAAGNQHGFVATAAPPSVPEPASLALFAVGGVLAAAYRRRRRA